MEGKNVLIGMVAVTALILGLYAAMIKPANKVTTITKPDGTTETVRHGGSGVDENAACVAQNGVTRCTERKEFNNGSTTLASFLSPNATSTLRYASGSITTASTSALQFEWGRSNLFDATSTSLGIYNLAASVKAMVLASTTGATVAGQISDLAHIIPPNSKVNLKYGGNTCPLTGGTCNTLEGFAIVEFVY